MKGLSPESQEIWGLILALAAVTLNISPMIIAPVHWLLTVCGQHRSVNLCTGLPGIYVGSSQSTSHAI